jgi:fido (protein-threonine AMPylation protein)
MMDKTSSSVYHWDHNCQRIHDKLEGNFSHMRRELNELDHDKPQDLKSILDYYKKWHYNNELFVKTMEEVNSRKRVLEMLIKQGYGVSLDLANDMTTHQNLSKEWFPQVLTRTFHGPLHRLAGHIYLPDEQKANHNSSYIIRELSKKLGDCHEDQIPRAAPPPPRIPIDHFLKISQETPAHAHMAILNGMFLELAEESGTIMEGTIGALNVDSPQLLKMLASRNLRELFNDLYETIGQDLTIDCDWIRHIHYYLTRDLDASHSWKAGEFRTEDFEDKSGLTFEFGNFPRGIDELAAFLQGVNWKTENFNRFTFSLAKLYYMLLGIHPFLDSNGRTAKCLVSHMMLRRGLPPMLYNVHEEILYLPRYGGSVHQMQSYFNDRIATSLERYFFEREKIAHFGNLEKHFFRVDFDAGFYFRHLNGLFPLIEVDYKTYIIPDDNPLSPIYLNQCKIVIPEEHLMGSMVIYYGFTSQGRPDWEEKGEITATSCWKRGPDAYGVPYFTNAFFIELRPSLARYDSLEISLACTARELIFNNKSLNYTFRMDRTHLMKLLGEYLCGRILSDEAFGNADLGAMRRMRDTLEWRAGEIIHRDGLHDLHVLQERRHAVIAEHHDIVEDFRSRLIPLLFLFIQRHNLTGRSEPGDADTTFCMHYCIQRLAPQTVYLLSYP